jgi:HPt (histidine-containing phosphotransfer) domain-containing protein
MASVRYWSRDVAIPLVSEDAFDELRDAFCERLEEERLHLISLGSALEDTEYSPARAIDAIVLSAHRLQGRAQIFEMPSVADAANVLEQAAIRASVPGAVSTDTSVRVAPCALVRLMACLETTSTVNRVVATGRRHPGNGTSLAPE